jgi:galactokinase/mevalonate kinase-like predicted kinase
MKVKKKTIRANKKSFKELECKLQGKLITVRLKLFPYHFKGSWAIFKDISNRQTNDRIYEL